MQSLWSSSSSCCVVCLVIVSFLANAIHVQARFVLPKGVKVPALFAFGDSIVDPGNNNHITTIVKCDFPPYGKDFMGGKPTGRFCNGKIPTDLIADILGITEIIPAYLDPTLKPADLLTGVSFASGASGYVPLTPKLATVISLPDQLTLFKEYMGKLKAYAGEATAASIISDSIYLLVAGSDDIANTYFTAGVQYKYDPNTYTDQMVQGASSFLQGLHDLGARRIGIFSAPPIGCVPSQRTLQGSIQRDCSERENEVAIMFNSKLSSALDQLKAKFTNGKFVYIDIYNPLLDIIQNPHNYGFEVANKGCCGTGVLEVSVLCNSLSSKTCADASKYVFWDSYHPTESCYKAIVYPVLQKYYKALL